MKEGNMMIPVDETVTLLNCVLRGQTPDPGKSIHHKIMLALIEENKELFKTQLGPFLDVEKKGLIRVNSGDLSTVTTFTNLVTGDEVNTTKTTIEACQNVFDTNPDATVILIVELDGTIGEGGRLQMQEDALRKQGFSIVSKNPLSREAAEALAQQSGVQLPERGPAPERVKLVVKSGKSYTAPS